MEKWYISDMRKRRIRIYRVYQTGISELEPVTLEIRR
jgi:hypothetical protein